MYPAEPHEIPLILGNATLRGRLQIPRSAAGGLVLFAHGSGSSRKSPRNSLVANRLVNRGLAVLLFDLLTEDEESIDAVTGQLRFNIALLAERLVQATRWAAHQPALQHLKAGYFGASTGAAAALVAAAQVSQIGAIVSRGGRPDLAGPELPEVRAPTLLIVGGRDTDVLALNRAALAQLRCPASLQIVPGATHLFEEPGALEKVSELAANWFERHLIGTTPQAEAAQSA